MMRGTKRFAAADSNPIATDSLIQSKRIMFGSALDTQRAEPSQQPLGNTSPPLDMQRAESSRRHVRALNSQFASWIQTQLESHQDELWEDGVQDYLNHAKNITEKFSDVVNWLKANATKVENMSGPVSDTTQKTFGSESKEKSSNLLFGKSGIPLASTIATEKDKNLLFGKPGTPLASTTALGKDNNVLFGKPGVPPGSTTSTEKNNNLLFGKPGIPPESTSATGKDNNFLFGKPGIPPSTTTSTQNDNNLLFGKPGIPPAGTTSTQKDNNLLFGKRGIPPASTTSTEKGNNLLFGKPGISPSSTTSTEKDNNLLFGKPGIPSVSATASFGTSWSSGALFNNKTPFSFGIQSSAPGTQNSVSSYHVASIDADGEEDVEQPSSPSVKKTEEKGITVVHEVKCKLYVKSTDPADEGTWKDRGTGNLSIKCKEGVDKGTRESRPTIVVRNDVGKVLLNALLYPGIKTNKQKNAIVAIFHTSGDGDKSDTVVARTFLIRTKSEEDRNKLAEVIQEYAPAA